VDIRRLVLRSQERSSGEGDPAEGTGRWGERSAEGSKQGQALPIRRPGSKRQAAAEGLLQASLDRVAFTARNNYRCERFQGLLEPGGITDDDDGWSIGEDVAAGGIHDLVRGD